MGTKKKGRDLALELYLMDNIENEEIARIVGVSVRTLSNWINEGSWKKQRALRGTTPQELESDLIEIIADCAKKRKEATSASERMQIADEVSKYNKVWDNLKKDSRLSLTAHTQVLSDFTNFCNNNYPALLAQLVKAQKEYITIKAKEYL